MDQLFAEHIVPAILGCEWPRLKSLRVCGFRGCNTQELERAHGRTETALEPEELSRLLTRCLGPTVETLLELDNGNLFEYCGQSGIRGWCQ